MLGLLLSARLAWCMKSRSRAVVLIVAKEGAALTLNDSIYKNPNAIVISYLKVQNPSRISITNKNMQFAQYIYRQGPPPVPVKELEVGVTPNHLWLRLEFVLTVVITWDP